MPIRVMREGFHRYLSIFLLMIVNVLPIDNKIKAVITKENTLMADQYNSFKIAEIDIVYLCTIASGA